MVDPKRVASRFLSSRDWGDGKKLLSDYNSSLANLNQIVSEQRDRGSPNPLILFRLGLSPFLGAARNLSEWILQTREIPSGEAKFVELATRTVLSLRKAPPNVISWYDRNEKWLRYLLKAAGWPDRSESTSDQVVTVGPFRVHNTVGADSKSFGLVRDLVQKATSDLESKLDFRKVLYGDLYVVGQLKQANHAAWYSVTEDDVYLRTLSKRGVDDLASFTHELGHRYWFKFANPEQKKAVSRLYYKLRSPSSLDLSLPKVGEPILVPIRGVRVPPTVVGYEGDRLLLSTGGFLKVREVWRILQDKQISAKFPSAYAMKNLEEFFAECFAFCTLGKASEELNRAFEDALQGKDV